MFAVVTDRAPVQKMTSLTMAPKPRLNFLSARQRSEENRWPHTEVRIGGGRMPHGRFDSLAELRPTSAPTLWVTKFPFEGTFFMINP